MSGFFPEEDKLFAMIRKRNERYPQVKPYLSSAKIDGRWRETLIEGAPPEAKAWFEEYDEAGRWPGEYRWKYDILLPRV